MTVCIKYRVFFSCSSLKKKDHTATEVSGFRVMLKAWNIPLRGHMVLRSLFPIKCKLKK